MTTIIRLKPRDESGDSSYFIHESSANDELKNSNKNVRNRPLYGKTFYWTGRYWDAQDSSSDNDSNTNSNSNGSSVVMTPTMSPSSIGNSTEDEESTSYWSAKRSWLEVEWEQMFPRASWYTANHSDEYVGSRVDSLEVSYAMTLLGCLLLWSFYLLLPKRIRRAYFGAPKRRYARSSEPFQPEHWTQKVIISNSNSRDQNISETSSAYLTINSNNNNSNNGNLHQESKSVLERKAHQQHNYLLGKKASRGVSMSNRVHSGIQQFRQTFSSSQSNFSGNSNNGRGFQDDEDEEVIFSDVGIYSHKETSNDTTTNYSFNFNYENNNYYGGESVASSDTNLPPPPYSEINYDSALSVVSSSIAPTSSVSVVSQYPPESPLHPDLNFAPPSSIVWHSTLQSLQDPGIRLVAHGVTTQPRTVWLQYFPRNNNNNNDNNNNNNPNPHLTWRTENKNYSKDSNSLTNGVASNDNNIWGPIHQLDLELILYVDVGSNTPALENHPTDVTFSLLTRQGSLDLQASTQTERNALVSCFCILLDRVHGPHRWRQLSQQPEVTSSANSDNNLSTL